jgi:hypothetical protein
MVWPWPGLNITFLDALGSTVLMAKIEPWQLYLGADAERGNTQSH